MRARTSSLRLVSWVEVAKQRGGPAGQPLGVQPVELVHGDPEVLGRSAHLVERDEAMVAVEGRVLDALGGDGAGELLELRPRTSSCSARSASCARRESAGAARRR